MHHDGIGNWVYTATPFVYTHAHDPEPGGPGMIVVTALGLLLLLRFSTKMDPSSSSYSKLEGSFETVNGPVYL